MKYRRSVILTSALLVLFGGLFLVSRTDTPSGAVVTSTQPTTTTARTVSDPSSGFYLDIGASASLGMQPNGIVGHDGHLTDTGYANDLVAREAARGVSLSLRQIGCPGETAESMAGQISDKCYHPPQTQMSTALGVLGADHSEVGLVTIDLGLNDVRPCLTVMPMDQSCANKGIALVREELPKVLRTLKGAAGPHVLFVGLEYADPYIAKYLQGAVGQADAAKTVATMTLLNQTLDEAYKAEGMSVANVPAAFLTNHTSPVKLSGVGTVPVEVARVCEWTWMCKTKPWGPDDHPNNAGYETIAKAIAAVLPSRW